MSATNRTRQDGSEYAREPSDYYRTPAWAVRALHPHLPQRMARKDFRVVDAGAGDGAVADALPYGLSTVCLETNVGKSERLRELGYHCPPDKPHDPLPRGLSFFDYAEPADVVVMNPPYSLAMEFVKHAVDLTRPRAGCVWALLRLPWLASQERAPFHRANPSHVLVLPRRPSFTKDGKTDATDYAFQPGTWDILDVEPRKR